MPNANIMNIIIKAEDKATQITEKVSNTFKKMGDVGNQANQKVRQSAQLTDKQYTQLGKEISEIVKSTDAVGKKGVNQFNRYSSSVQKSIVNFNRLDTETQSMLRYLSQMSDKGRETFVGMSSKAQEAIAKFNELENETKNWGNTFDYTKSKMQLMGTDVDSIKGKVQVAGSAIKTHVGDKWDIVKSKVSSTAQKMKSDLGGAINWVKGKVQSLASSFGGLGGVISSAVGALGVKSVGDLTIGLAMTREQMTSLSQATLGSKKSADKLIQGYAVVNGKVVKYNENMKVGVNGVTKAFQGLDNMTNNSLVSLNDLGQSMNIIKMSTGMSNTELENFSSLVNDVGQRAILMGKDSTEAMSLMTATADGLNGNFDVLKNNFGITADKLKDLDWSGATDDVKGYQKAVEEYLEKSGSMDEMMETTPGKIARVRKAFTTAGRKIGEEFMPYINDVLDYMLKLKDEADNGGPNIFQYLIGIAGGVSILATALPMLEPALGVFNTMSVAISNVRKINDGLSLSILKSPWFWLIGVLAIVAVAIYEVGKSWGWWSNVSEMLSAVTDGVRRVWEAFSNSPVVQQEIENLKTDLFKLWDILKNVSSSILQVFNVPTNGSFDFVHSLVEFFERWGPTILTVSKYATGLYLVFMGYRAVLGVVAKIILKYGQLKTKILETKKSVSDAVKSAKDKYNSLKEKISDVKGKVVELKNDISSSWNEGKLNTVKQKFIQIKDSVLSAKDKVVEFAGKIKELAVAKITALKDAFMGVAEKISLATIKEKLYALWQGIINGLTAVWNFLLNMNPIGLVIIAIVALVATLMYLYNTNETVRNAINWLWEQLQVLGAWITDNLISAWNSLVTALQPVVDMLVSVLGPAIQGIIALFSGDTTGALTFFQQAWTNLLSALQPVSDFLSSVFGPAWDLIITCISTVWNTVQGVVGAFQMFLSGQISLPELLQTIWSLISNMYLTIFRTIINFVINFAKSIVNKAKNAGLNFLNGILNYIQQLPSRFISYLSSVVGGIISAGASWVNNARNKASAMVSGVISYVSQLPGKVYTEFSNIGSRILQAGSDLVNKAKNIGKNIVDGLLGAMGIHSPGTIQTSVVLEFTNMIDRVKDKVKSAKESAVIVAKSMVDGFKSQDVESALDVKPNLETTGPLVGNVLDNQQMTTTITPEFNESDNQHIVDGYNSMGQNVTSIFSNMSDKVNTSLNGLSSANEKTYSVIATTEQNNMNKMSNHVKGSMNKILNNTKTGLKNTSNTTNTNLKNMQNSTAKTTQKMTSAWNTMRVSIVNSASKIKSESTNHFSRLSSTIGGFYRKLQNPGGWGAGGSTGKPSNTRRVGHKSGGLKKITNAMKQVKTPQYLSLGQIKRNPLINSDFGGYITSFKNNKYSVSDLIRAGSIKIPVGLEDPKNKGAGGWSDSVRPNVSKIKSTARKWSMKGPKIVGKYQTSKGFKVGDFENGTPNIGFSDFKRMAEDVFSQCHYEFYYDSNKYGNWLTAFKHGGMNCSDSSDALIAMAHACGLSASKVHGHWNSFGHYWANVEGHKMDTTGYMNQRNWTPSQSHAGSPMTGNPFDDIIDAIKSLFEDDKPTPKNNILSSSVDSEYMELGGTVTIIHEFVNLPENISSEEVSRLVNEATTDDNWIKSLVKNVRFQNYDLEVKEKLIKKDNRARGV